MYNLSWGQDEEKIGYTREWVSDEGKDEQVRRGASVRKNTNILRNFTACMRRRAVSLRATKQHKNPRLLLRKAET